MSDKSKVIFGNEMSAKTVKKAERSKKKYARRYGDDSAAAYPAKPVENRTLFGSLINTMAPIHVKQDSLLHDIIARVVKMGEEKEDCRAKGAVLMQGVRLSQGFSGTGYSDQVRLFPDFASRMYS